jgi:hypothetical protein
MNEEKSRHNEVRRDSSSSRRTSDSVKKNKRIGGWTEKKTGIARRDDGQQI